MGPGRDREGRELVAAALRPDRSSSRPRRPGKYTLLAAIAAVHAQAPSYRQTDWREIIGLYNLLLEVWPSPVVALNRAAAIGLGLGPAAGLAATEALAGRTAVGRLPLPGRDPGRLPPATRA